ncbi:hypothetical protein YC2023_034725 [Brassica napus]
MSKNVVKSLIYLLGVVNYRTSCSSNKNKQQRLAIGACVGNPADLALIRMQADNTLPLAQPRNYTNAFHEGVLA